MKKINRRNFIRLLGLSAAAAATPALVKAASGIAKPRIVVVGGGFAGSTAAKYLRLWSGNQIDVILIDNKPSHVSCVMSNLVVNGRLNMNDITFNHDILVQKYGIEFIQGTVNQVSGNSDNSNFFVSLAGSPIQIQCDFVILAPGIAFDEMPGLNHWKTPHAWTADHKQTALLRQQLDRMPIGGSFVMTIPRTPYRCPHAPYERACIVADMMKRNGGGKVIVLDMNNKITSEESMFSSAFTEIYRNTIEYIPNVEIDFVDSDNLCINTNKGVFNADVMNIIPPQKAGKIVSDLGFANDASGRWANVDPISHELKNHPGIFVIGDSVGINQPKSGRMANAQAKVCVQAILKTIAGQSVHHPGKLTKLASNSANYSAITYSTAAAWNPVNSGNETNNRETAITSSSQLQMHNNLNYRNMFASAQKLFDDTLC